MKKTKHVIKSAVTGRFINKGYAKGHGSTSFAETVPVKKAKKKKRA